MSDAQLSFRKSANIDRVTDKRKDSLFRLVDTDGSGTIDAQEFAVLYDAIKKDLAEELEKEAELAKEASSARRRFKMLLLFVAVLVSFLAASVAANFAVIFAVVDQAITTTTTSTGLLEVKGTGSIAKTAIATQDMPLMIAPVIDLETLYEAKTLKVQYTDPMTMDDGVAAMLSIVAVRKHNTTFVEFITDVPGESVQVLNGEAHLVRMPVEPSPQNPPKVFPICSANATCSAFRASGIDLDAAYDLAREELSKAGFGDAARRLTPATSWCYWGTWTSTYHCGYEYLGGGSWIFRGYCFPTAADGSPAPLGGLLEGEYPANSGVPMWYDNYDTWQSAPPAPPHPIPDHNDPAGAHTFVWYWPPSTGFIASYYYDGWGPQRHVVFFAHGKYGYWANMYNRYCNAGPPMDCPAFEEGYFQHLVFVFGSSGIIDYGFLNACGWSRDYYNAYSFNDAAQALSNIPDQLAEDWNNNKIVAMNCKTFKVYVCDWFKHYNIASAVREVDKEEDGRRMEEAATDNRVSKEHKGGETDNHVMLRKTHFDAYCQIEERVRCPFNAKTEYYIVGFSDGAGLGMYMNYWGAEVTGVSAGDYWGYASYTSWLLSSAGHTVNAKIYTNCKSSMFDYGPDALWSSTSSGTSLTYVTGSFTDFSSQVTPSSTTTRGDLDYYVWEWGPAHKCDKARIKLAVHGLGVSSTQGPPTSFFDKTIVTDPDFIYSDEWDAENMCNGATPLSSSTGGEVHSEMFDYHNGTLDVYDWINPNDWAECPPASRQLKELGKFSADYTDDGKEMMSPEEWAHSKPIAYKKPREVQPPPPMPKEKVNDFKRSTIKTMTGDFKKGLVVIKDKTPETSFGLMSKENPKGKIKPKSKEPRKEMQATATEGREKAAMEITRRASGIKLDVKSSDLQ